MNYYQNKYPEVNEVVFGKMISLNMDTGYTVTLPEYNDIDAFLPISVVLRRNLRKKDTIKSRCPLNSMQILVVTTVDLEKAHVGVSRKNVYAEDLKAFPLYYNLTTKLNNLMKRLSHISDKSVSELLENIIWPNFSKNIEDLSVHPANVLKNRDSLKDLKLTDKYCSILLKHHFTLFGANLIHVSKTLRLNSFQLNGTQEIISLFEKIIKEFQPTELPSPEEMYYDQSLYILEIRPIAIPQYEIVVTSCSEETSNKIADRIAEQLITNISEGSRGYGKLISV